MAEQKAREKESSWVLSFNSFCSVGRGNNSAQTMDWGEDSVIRQGFMSQTLDKSSGLGTREESQSLIHEILDSGLSSNKGALGLSRSPWGGGK